MEWEIKVSERDTDGERPDGRQPARDIVRGTQRLLRSMGYTSIAEYTLNNGRRVDVAGLGPKGEIFFIEVKSSLADFRSDEKWGDYLDYCDRFFFAVSPEFPAEVLPSAWGLILADRFGAEIVRDSPPQKLNGSRRRSIILDFARNAASRLQTVLEEEI